ncbi:MAG TPA: NAD-dependent epimerase/dehydratase family protein [Mycobacterium sp.]
MKLVIGASGFVGSHVTRQLAQRGDDVRVMVRKTSSTDAISDLDVEYCYGDIFDDQALREAINGCDVVFYCVVDTRAWLRDPAPLFKTNVEGLRHVLDAAVTADLKRFVFTSTIGTIALSDSGPATEDEPFNWYDKGGGYIQSRVQAENLVLQYARQRGLPAVVMCVSNTFGPHDWGPTPHGGMLALAAAGKMPVSVSGVSWEVVGIEDVAKAFLLAADKGRIGERYIISERFMPVGDIFDVAADATGAKRPRVKVPFQLIRPTGVFADVAARILRRDLPINKVSMRLAHIMSPMDHGKAVRELGWQPEPTPEAIGRAALFFEERRKRR